MQVNVGSRVWILRMPCYRQLHTMGSASSMPPPHIIIIIQQQGTGFFRLNAYSSLHHYSGQATFLPPDGTPLSFVLSKCLYTCIYNQQLHLNSTYSVLFLFRFSSGHTMCISCPHELKISAVSGFLSSCLIKSNSHAHIWALVSSWTLPLTYGYWNTILLAVIFYLFNFSCYPQLFLP